MNLPARLYCLDVARGVAAFSVVLWHWQHFFFSAPGVLSASFKRDSLPLYSVLAPIYNHGGDAAVSFFFLLSGFVFFWLYKDRIEDGSCSLREFWVARFSRLYPLHFITLILVAVLQFAYRLGHADYFVYPFNNPYHFGLNLIFGSYWGFEKGFSFNAPAWSVSQEIGVYFVFFAVVATRRASWRYVVAFLAVLVLGPKLGVSIHRWQKPLELFLLGGLTFYALRFYLSHAWRSRLSDYLAIGFPIAAWASIALSETVSSMALSSYALLSRVVFPASIVGLVLLETTAKVPFARLKWIGDCTYASYLLHFPLQLLFILAAPLVLSRAEQAFYSPWMLLLFFLILIPLSLTAFNLFEAPLQSHLRRIGMKLM